MAIYKDTERGTWYYSIYYTDVYGKPKRKKKRGFKTKKACKVAEAEMLSTLKPEKSDKIRTFEDVFEERIKNANLTPRTEKNRRDQYKKYIRYNFAKLPIDKITVEQCKDLRLQLVENPNLSDEYKRTVFSGFKAVLKYALMNQYIEINPALAVEPIRFNKTKFLYITREKFDELVMKMDGLDNMNPTLYRIFIQLLFYTGLRVGEALPLTWEDWDPVKKELDINKTTDITTNEIRYGIAKTKSSLDSVPVPQNMVDTLEELRKLAKPNDVYIFGGNKPVTYSTITTAFYKVFREWNSKVTLHTLRHSYATHLINNGVDIYVLMNLLRHSTIEETIGTYSHLYTDKKQKAMSIFD